jgi:hypothetical protein
MLCSKKVENYIYLDNAPIYFVHRLSVLEYHHLKNPGNLYQPKSLLATNICRSQFERGQEYLKLQ